MTSSDHNEPNYDVGYGRPPLQHRFRKGHSGNPKGKEPKRKNLKTELLEELATKILVNDGGQQRKISKQSIIVKRMVSDAAKGDAKARDQLLRLLDQVEKSQPPPSSADPIGSARDAEVLARFRSELIKSIKDE